MKTSIICPDWLRTRRNGKLKKRLICWQAPADGGGATCFADMRAAFDELDPQTQSRLETLECVCSFGAMIPAETAPPCFGNLSFKRVLSLCLSGACLGKSSCFKRQFRRQFKKESRFVFRSPSRGEVPFGQPRVGPCKVWLAPGCHLARGPAPGACPFLSFPYVCPEPVLVKCSVLYINGAKRPFFCVANQSPSSFQLGLLYLNA